MTDQTLAPYIRLIKQFLDRSIDAATFPSQTRKKKPSSSRPEAIAIERRAEMPAALFKLAAFRGPQPPG